MGVSQDNCKVLLSLTGEIRLKLTMIQAGKHRRVCDKSLVMVPSIILGSL